MKKVVTTIALFAVLGTLAVSCQKENIIDETAFVEESGARYTVRYTVDGVIRRITLVGDEAWRDFLNRMFAMAEEGHKVSFCKEEATSRVVSFKNVVTYTTKNHDDAYGWADKMIDEGYIVTISYDRETGVYTCEAIK